MDFNRSCEFNAAEEGGEYYSCADSEGRIMTVRSYSPDNIGGRGFIIAGYVYRAAQSNDNALQVDRCFKSLLDQRGIEYATTPTI